MGIMIVVYCLLHLKCFGLPNDGLPLDCCLIQPVGYSSSVWSTFTNRLNVCIMYLCIITLASPRHIADCACVIGKFYYLILSISSPILKSSSLLTLLHVFCVCIVSGFPFLPFIGGPV